MDRFKTVIGLNLHWCLVFYFKLKHGLFKNSDDWQERYEICRWITLKILAKSKIKVSVFGIENLPNENGYMICPNHQSSFDGIAMLTSHERQVSVAINEARSNILIEKHFMDLINAKRLDKTNPKKMFLPMKELAEEIKNGHNYIVFPEGQWGENKNTMQEFYTGCFHFMKNTKKPIVPVCLYDCWKVYEIKKFNKVTAQVHYLKPIYYEEYKDLSKQEIADLVKSRIQNKLNELVALEKYADEKGLVELPVIKRQNDKNFCGFINRKTGEFREVMIAMDEDVEREFINKYQTNDSDDVKMSY